VLRKYWDGNGGKAREGKGGRGNMEAGGAWPASCLHRYSESFYGSRRMMIDESIKVIAFSDTKF